MFVEQRRGITIKDIPLDDADTFKLLCEGQTVSTFQFDSEGIGKWLRELQPTSFSDLVALNALYRQGTLDLIPDLIACEHGERPSGSALPAVDECLKDTYGMVVYQEQIMLLAQKLAGFTPNKSDKLRKAFMKRKEEDIAHFKKLFIEKATAKGYEREQIKQMWEDWEHIGCYLFNKSHAVCYSLLGYQTAYLKAHFPTEYMAARLRYDLNNQEALSDCLFKNNYTEWLGNDLDKDLQECHRMGIRVKGLDRTCVANRVTIDEGGTICCNQTAHFLRTGIKPIDDSIGGFPLGSMTLIVGRPAMGKTLLSLILAKSVGADNNIPVMYFSLEQSNVQLVNRLLSIMSGIDVEKMKHLKLNPSEADVIEKQAEILKGAPLYIDDTPSLSVADFRTKAMRCVQEKGVKLIIVDYIQLMNLEGKFTNSSEELNTTLGRVQRVAKELDVAVVVNKQAYKHIFYPNRLPNESRALPTLDEINTDCNCKKYADVICVLHRPGFYHEEPADAWNLIVAKNRFGYTTNIELGSLWPYKQRIRKNC